MYLLLLSQIDIPDLWGFEMFLGTQELREQKCLRTIVLD
jgi:hypothetical protein